MITAIESPPAVKERGIIMSGDNPRKCADGTKWQTRRVIKPQPYFDSTPADIVKAGGNRSNAARSRLEWICGGAWRTPEEIAGYCPHGRVGDRLWVKQTWRYELANGVYGVRFKSDDLFVPARQGLQRAAIAAGISGFAHGKSPWRTHTPRWAARTWLEITDVRVERLWDISEDDVIAEGVPCLPREGTISWISDTRSRMAYSWNRLHGPGAWESKNLWVWVLTFKRIHPAPHP